MRHREQPEWDEREHNGEGDTSSKTGGRGGAYRSHLHKRRLPFWEARLDASGRYPLPHLSILLPRCTPCSPVLSVVSMSASQSGSRSLSRSGSLSPRSLNSTSLPHSRSQSRQMDPIHISSQSHRSPQFFRPNPHSNFYNGPYNSSGPIDWLAYTSTSDKENSYSLPVTPITSASPFEHQEGIQHGHYPGPWRHAMPAGPVRRIA